MKKIFTLTLLVLLAVVPMTAQKTEKSKEEMRKELHEFKLKYLAQEMKLKKDQQQKFFDLYDQMSKERRNVFKESYKLGKSVRENKNATEDDYARAEEAKANAKAKWVESEKKWDAKFAEFLTPKQIFKMKEAEQKFHDRMKEMRKK